MNTSTYGDWLRTYRTRLGFTQKQLETAAGLGQSHLSKIERKKNWLPEKDTRDRIHHVFGTSDDDLVEAGILLRTTGLDGMPVYRGLDEVMALPEIPRTVAETAGTYDILPRLLARVETWQPDRQRRLFDLIADMDVADRAERS